MIAKHKIRFAFHESTQCYSFLESKLKLTSKQTRTRSHSRTWRTFHCQLEVQSSCWMKKAVKNELKRLHLLSVTWMTTKCQMSKRSSIKTMIRFHQSQQHQSYLEFLQSIGDTTREMKCKLSAQLLTNTICSSHAQLRWFLWHTQKLKLSKPKTELKSIKLEKVEISFWS